MNQQREMFRKPLGVALVLIIGLLSACGGGGGGGAPAPVPAVPPAIAAQPSAVVVADGSSANFNVTATGDAPLAYQWRRDGLDLVDAAGVAGAKSPALTLVAPYGFNASQVSVRVSNAVGSVVSSNALLTVTPLAPAIATQPANVTVIANAPATFSVVISGGTAPVSFQWKRNGTVIAGATNPSYTIPGTVIGDNGASFAVDIHNPAGTMSSTAALLTVMAVGKTWSDAVRINFANDPSNSLPSDPQVVIDSAGNAISVWREILPDPRNAVLARRYAAGGSWSTAAPIDGPIGNAIQPQIAMTPGGTAVATFSQTTAVSGGGNQIIANRFGGAWAVPQRLDGDVVFGRAYGPQVALAPDGATTVVFTLPDTNHRVWAARSDSAGVWSAAMTVGNSPSNSPQVAVAANGQVVMTWLEPAASGRYMSSLWASLSAGTGWSTPVKISADADSVLPIRVAADANGNAIAVWQQNVGNRPTVFATQLDAISKAWSAPFMLNDGTKSAYEPQVAADDNGNTMVVWNEGDAGGASLGVLANRFVAATGTWSGPMAVQPPTAPRGAAPQVAVDAKGNAIAVWRQHVVGNGSRYEVWGAHFSTATGVWAPPVNFMSNAAAYVLTGSGHQPKISANADGGAVVVWFEQADTPLAAGLWARVYR
ncbi:MAG: hypothetical protein Q8K67_06745 [Geothrix sp.]|nr:hypothetical protein [Geothrix sp.]